MCRNISDVGKILHANVFDMLSLLVILYDFKSSNTLQHKLNYVNIYICVVAVIAIYKCLFMVSM